MRTRREKILADPEAYLRSGSTNQSDLAGGDAFLLLQVVTGQCR